MDNDLMAPHPTDYGHVSHPHHNHQPPQQHQHQQQHSSHPPRYDFGAPIDNPFDDAGSKFSRPAQSKTSGELATAGPSSAESSSTQLRWRLKTNKSSDVFEQLMVDIEAKMLEKQKQEAAQAQARARRLQREMAAERRKTSHGLQHQQQQHHQPHQPPDHHRPGGGGGGGSGGGGGGGITEMPHSAMASLGGMSERHKKMLSFDDDGFDHVDGPAVEVHHHHHHHNRRLDYNHPLRITARRGWALIRRSIREKAVAKKNRSNMQWTMLNQTIKNISNKNAGRQKLYDKYLNPKKPRMWTEGIKSIPIDFFSRNARRIQEKIRDVPQGNDKKNSITDAQLRDMEKTRATMFNHSAKIRLISPNFGNSSRISLSKPE